MIRFSHMEIGRFANAAMCLLVAEEEIDYLLIHVQSFKIVSFFAISDVQQALVTPSLSVNVGLDVSVSKLLR